MEESQIKVSVIIPVYNMEKYLGECLDSVFGQTLKDIEVICVDDGSTDNTINILNKYKEKHENLIVFSQHRKGAGIARNKGLEVAIGEYIAFMDSDDYYPSNDVLEYLYNGAKENQVVMAGGNLYRLVNGQKRKCMEENIQNEGTDRIVEIEDYQYPYGFYRFIYQNILLKENHIVFPNLVRNQDPPFMLDALIASQKIWITPKEVYVIREFDKKIEFTSKNVICDIMSGYLYMMKKAKDNNLVIAQEIFMNRIRRQQELLIMHVCNGNTELYELIQEIGNEIINLDEKRSFIKFWNINNVQIIYDEKKDIIEALKKEILKYKKVLIYGAGQYGKTLYDFLSQIDGIEFLGFAVSDSNPIGTARGFTIRSLSEYKVHVEDALVLIAVREDIDDEMKNYAEKLGFKNIEVIQQQIGYIGINQVTNGKFAFDNY